MSERIKNLIYILLYFILFSITVAAFLQESWVAFFLSILIICAIFGLRFFFRKSTIVYPQEIEIALVLFLILSFVLDEFAFVQHYVLFFDVIKHVISGALFGLIAFILVYAMNHFHKSSLRLNSFFVSLFSFSFSIAFSFLWIIFENIIEEIFVINDGVHSGYVISQLWTIFGVVMGALLVAIAGYQYLEKGTYNIVGWLLGKFFSANPSHRTALKSTRDDTVDIIGKGETQSIEFKSTLRINLYTNKKDKKIEHAILKTICAFLNTEGGVLFVGIGDNGKILGLNKDEFANNDKFQLHFTNIFNQNIGEQFTNLIQAEIIDIYDKQVFRIDCFRSDVPVFLQDGQRDEFFIRVGVATQELQGSKLMKYITKNF